MEKRAAASDFKLDRIVPFFQPIMELSENKVWRYECLARLLTDSERIFLPNEFLYLVEKKHSNAALTHHIYQLSSRYCAHKNMPWSINLSASDLSDEDLLPWLSSLYSQRGNRLFGLELSYQDVVNNIDVLKQLIKQCADITITIDDVDSASDELDEILHIGVDALKLKGAFVKRFAQTGEGKDTLIEIQHRCLLHDTKLVAEHIEDKATCDAVRALGIMYGQGFYFSTPSASV